MCFCIDSDAVRCIRARYPVGEPDPDDECMCVCHAADPEAGWDGEPYEPDDASRAEVEPLRYDGACGDLAPDGARVCIMLAGHLGNHAHAPDGTADWTAWTPSGDLMGTYSFPAPAGR